jgi:hypothetical protein
MPATGPSEIARLLLVIGSLEREGSFVVADHFRRQADALIKAVVVDARRRELHRARARGGGTR